MKALPSKHRLSPNQAFDSITATRERLYWRNQRFRLQEKLQADDPVREDQISDDAGIEYVLQRRVGRQRWLKMKVAFRNMISVKSWVCA